GWVGEAGGGTLEVPNEGTIAIVASSHTPPNFSTAVQPPPQSSAGDGSGSRDSSRETLPALSPRVSPPQAWMFFLSNPRRASWRLVQRAPGDWVEDAPFLSEEVMQRGRATFVALGTSSFYIPIRV
ncbi:hypothetical protein CYMTET_35040, partial [Cymbomonas tetramitiformis]